MRPQPPASSPRRRALLPIPSPAESELMNASASAVRRIWRTVAVAGLAFGARDAQAQISVSGPPAAMKVTMAVAGSAPTAVSNALTTYSLSSNPAGHFTVTAPLQPPPPPPAHVQEHPGGRRRRGTR